jgi:hypothetical protein
MISPNTGAQQIVSGTGRGIADVAHASPAEFAVATDRVRWGPILAGLVSCVASLLLFSVLGIAIGAMVYDPAADDRGIGTFASIWGAIAALVSFFIGGYFAASTAAFRGARNGLLHGGLVWAAALSLILIFAGGAMGSLLGTGVNVLGPDMTRNNAAGIRGQMTEINSERAASGTSKAAWWTLVSLVLGLGAAAAGGYIGGTKDLFAGAFSDKPADRLETR